MMSAISRRSFLATLPAAAVFAQTKPLKITAVEIWQLHGHRDTVRGIDQQFQANPLFIYDELRPKPYAEPPGHHAELRRERLVPEDQNRRRPGRLYGPIDKEVAIVMDEQLRSFLIGKDALAQEKLWDQLYRSNRHARRGAFPDGDQRGG